MPILDYGVWKGRPVRVSAERLEQDATSPHIHLFFDDGAGGHFAGTKRASINVKSLSEISELVYWHLPDLRHPITDALRHLPRGFTPLQSLPGGAALDYIRSNILDFDAGRILPHDLPGRVPNDIIDFVLPELQAAIARRATVYLLGEPYSDRQGLHDIHMNQGSTGRFAQYNGPWQDGAVILHYEDEDRFEGLFTAFASQAMHTDETQGHALPGAPTFAAHLGRRAPSPHATPPPDMPLVPDSRVVICGALVNPEGVENRPSSTGQPETVYLMNRSDTGLSLAGWRILNKLDEARVLAGDAWLAPGAVLAVPMSGVVLSNRGGTITLLDPAGLKVDGVSYTAAEARPEGQVLTFRR
ncbi:MAG: DUF2278 family protein [Rhodobacteraceae bacterium]|nr:DUF2278 family protein [Paracoccaceae bacterium]MBR9823616.1 DUF2278 family protein [Paracoccaceae bacterium]